MSTWTRQSKSTDAIWTRENKNSANWTNEFPYENGQQIMYNQSATTYNDIRYTYNGKLKTNWTNETKSS